MLGIEGEEGYYLCKCRSIVINSMFIHPYGKNMAG